ETYVLEGPRVRLVDGRRSPAAQTAHERVRDHLHEPSGDRSVERVAAVLHHLRAQLHCRRLRRHHDPSQQTSPLTCSTPPCRPEPVAALTPLPPDSATLEARLPRRPPGRAAGPTCPLPTRDQVAGPRARRTSVPGPPPA